MGSNILKMGISKRSSLRRPASLADALFSRTRQAVLGLLFGQPERSFFATEMIARVGAGSGAVQRELARLEESGLVTTWRVGTQKHYQSNPESPLFAELCGIAKQVVGRSAPSSAPVHGRARARTPAFAVHDSSAAYEVAARSGIEAAPGALARICRKYGVRKLSLFGSAARREMKSTSDVDLLVEFGPESRASLFDFPAMQRDFSALFGHRRVDLVPPAVLKNPYRRKAILADLRVIYEAR